jgi:hypothetical protein
MPELTIEKLYEARAMLLKTQNEDFHVVVHPKLPNMPYLLRVMEARDEYKLECHKKRWEKRFGKP